MSRRPWLPGLLAAGLALAAMPASAATDLLAFTRAVATRQGTFEAGGVAWSCGGELCSAKGPDDAALWTGLCVAFVREAGTVVAFGSVKKPFDAAELARCNDTAGAATQAAPPVAAVAAPTRTPAPTPAAAATPSPTPVAAPATAPPPAAPPAAAAKESCSESVRVWEDRDHDLFGDPARPREVCPHELGPGLVLNDYDCDDSNPQRNPGRDNCG